MTVTAVQPTDADQAEDGGRRRSRVRLLAVVVALCVAAAGAWFFLVAPSGSDEPAPGEIATLEAIQVNLAEGHYLRLGMALQLTEDAHEVDGSMALDAAIEVFSGLPLTDVTRPGQREALREQLMAMLEERYHGDVMGVYFTEFVTQ